MGRGSEDQVTHLQAEKAALLKSVQGNQSSLEGSTQIEGRSSFLKQNNK